MLFKLVQFGCFIVFGLLSKSIGQIVFGKQGSDVSIVIKFSYYPWSCENIHISFQPKRHLSSPLRWMHEDVMTFSDHGFQCLSKITPEYEARIFNVSLNFPMTVTFNLRNVSFQDSGLYTVFYSHRELGEGILLLSDTVVQTCTSGQVKLDCVVSLSAVNELLAVMVFALHHYEVSTITICNPKAGTCAPPKSNLECRINETGIYIILNSVQTVDQGVYEIIGSTSGVTYLSVVLNVTECVSPPASDMPLKTTGLLNSTTEEDPVGNTGASYSPPISTSGVLVTDQSFTIKEEYFVGGGAVAGVAFVTLALRFLCKWCLGRRRSGAGVDQYDIPDVHYYSTVRSQYQCAPESH